MQASPGQPTWVVSAQLGCQQSFWSIKDRRTPGNFTARLLFNLYTQIPETFLYNNVLSSHHTTVRLHFKDPSVPAAQVSPMPSSEGSGGAGWQRGGESCQNTQHSSLRVSPGAGLLPAVLPVLSPGVANFSLRKEDMRQINFWQFLDPIAIWQSACFWCM